MRRTEYPIKNMLIPDNRDTKCATSTLVLLKRKKDNQRITTITVDRSMVEKKEAEKQKPAANTVSNKTPQFQSRRSQ